MVTKHSELVKRQARYHYGRFASPSNHTAPPSLRPVTPPTPTRVEEVSSDDSPSDSSGYNDKCSHVKEVSSYELLLDFNYLV
jgi:hypothetical protein